MTVSETARTNMIESQLRPNGVIDPTLLEAFARIRRELFVPEPLRAIAYVDEDLPLGGGRYLMEPRVLGKLLQEGAVRRTDAAFVVGAGGGYEAAVLSVLARHVVAVEEDAELARRARAALVEHGIAAVNVVEGPLREGWRGRAPYDVILFTGAVAAVPEEISAQLADGGRLLAVVKAGAAGVGRAILVQRIGGGFGRRTVFDATAPLLPGFLPKSAFVF
jgi:protein-L-isoaspartate(D-aspartate) O-methyltransferase